MLAEVGGDHANWLKNPNNTSTFCSKTISKNSIIKIANIPIRNNNIAIILRAIGQGAKDF